MKNIVDFILEQKFTADSKVRIGDARDLLEFLRSEIENIDPQKITVTGDGIKYNKMLVPDTKLSKGITAGEYADILVNWLNEFNEKIDKASQKVKYRRLRKNLGVPRGNYGAKEKQEERERRRNFEIINQQ